MTVKGKHGLAQASEEQVCIIWDGCLFFFPTEHLDGVVSLLQALQQEIALKQAEKEQSDWKGGVIFAGNPETGV